MTNPRKELADLLVANRVYLSNICREAGDAMDKMVTDFVAEGKASETDESAIITRRHAQERRDLADQIAALIIKDNAFAVSEDLDLSNNDLKNMMRDPRYWRDQDPELVEKVREGFRRLYG